MFVQLTQRTTFMALTSLPPFLSLPSYFSFKLSSHFNSDNSLFFTQNAIPPLSIYPFCKQNVICNCSKQESRDAEKFKSGLLNEELLRRISSVKEADEAMDIIMEAKEGQGGGEVKNEDCRAIIAAAIDRGNVDLALSVFHAMRSSFGKGLNENISSIKRWSWARPDASTYALLVHGLAASLRVSDAIRIITYISGAGVSFGEEVRFGVIVPCPTCTIAIAVAQPQHGTQVASCSQCRYQYQLISGDIVSIQSEIIRMYYCRTQHG